MNYAKAIKTIRAARGLEQKELAERLEVDPSYVSLIEGGRRVPSMKVIEKIAQALDVPVYLLVLLASEREDLRNVSEEDARQLGAQLLDVVLNTKPRRKS